MLPDQTRKEHDKFDGNSKWNTKAQNSYYKNIYETFNLLKKQLCYKAKP